MTREFEAAKALLALRNQGESKLFLKEQKEVIERQDLQLKTVFNFCVNSIQQMKENISCGPSTSAQANRSISPPQIIEPRTFQGSRSFSIEPELNNLTLQSNRIDEFNRLTRKYNHRERVVQAIPSLVNANQQAERPLHSSTPLPTSNPREQKNITLCFDQASQTEESYLKPSVDIEKIEEMEAVLMSLYQKFQKLFLEDIAYKELTATLSPLPDVSCTETNTTGHTTDEDSAETAEAVPHIGAEVVMQESDHTLNNTTSSEDLQYPNSPRVRRMSAQTTNNVEVLQSQDDDMVAIGNGHAKIPRTILHGIDWTSYTSATRHLLQAVFPRSVLATHCLTGKKSPAFMNRPAKKILDPKLVEDIVKVVSTRCGVPKRLVRNSITTKCTDEAKLYKNRLRYKQQRKKIQNDENVSPSSLSSD